MRSSFMAATHIFIQQEITSILYWTLQLFDFLYIYIMSRICFFDLCFSALTEVKRDHRFMSSLFLYASPLIIAKRRLQSGLFGISAEIATAIYTSPISAYSGSAYFF